jgi:hypothetical protein
MNNGVLALDLIALLVGYSLRRWSIACSNDHGLDPKENPCDSVILKLCTASKAPTWLRVSKEQKDRHEQ